MSRAPIGDAEIGQRVRALRQQIGLSAADLAKALGVTISSVKELETGRGTRQFVQLRDLARILNVTPNVLLGVDESQDMVGKTDFALACVEAMLIDVEGWPPEKAEELTNIALSAATEKQILDLDRRLSAQAAAVARLRGSKIKP